MNADKYSSEMLFGMNHKVICLGLLLLAVLKIDVVSAQVKTKVDLGLAQFDSDDITQHELLKSQSLIEISRKSVIELINSAKYYSPGLREVSLGEDASIADIDAAKGAKYPKVTVTGQSTYTEGDLAMSQKAAGKPSLVVTAEYTLYDWGRIDANIRGREFGANTEKARKRLVTAQLTTDVLSACLELNKQVKILRANEEYISKIGRLAKLLTKITEQDSGREGELLQTRSRLLQGELATETVRSRVKEVKLRLIKLLGENRESLCEKIGPSLMKVPAKERLLDTLKTHPEVVFFKEQYGQANTNVEQISALKKPQVTVQAQHAPRAPGVSDLYTQSVNVLATIPLYDGNTLKSNEIAAINRANASLERVQLVTDRLNSELQERAQQTSDNLARAEAYIGLLHVNQRVINDFYIQWTTLGRRTLFELLALQAEQLSLKINYFTTLHDGMNGVAYLETQLGLLPENPQ